MTDHNKIRFHDLIGDITPIKPTPAQLRPNPVPKQPNQRKINSQHQRPLSNKAHGQDIRLNLDHIPEHQFVAMVAGNIRHDVILDLHGWFVDDALRYLDDKLHERKNRHLAYWLIIHGKGQRSPDYDRAPLKNAVLDFLQQQAAVAALSAVKDSDANSGGIRIAVHPARI